MAGIDYHGVQCALAKLSYLLSKHSISREKVRTLVGEPIRGELTRHNISPTAAPSIDKNLSDIQGLLHQIVRLASDVPPAAALAISPTMESLAPEYSKDDAAPWSTTASEAAATEAALYPFLVHTAAARDDVDGIAFCIQAASAASASMSASGGRTVPGGIVNCLDPASGRSPLHTAALNGSLRCTSMLLQAGALVHIRDALGHTALYYVRQFSF
jgi:60kDa lysophospholipase